MSGIALKRCTLVVQDVRRSIAFYRDTLGLPLLREEMPTLSGKIIPAGLPDARAHLAVIDAGSMELGLLQWIDPPLAKPDDPYPMHLGVGNRVFVMECPDVAALFARLRLVHEARIQCPLYAWSVPAPDGGKIEMTSLSFFDPDGFFCEVHQKRNAPNPPHLTLKRTTLIVSDIAVSLAFYRDTLGLTVLSDITVPFGNEILPANVAGAKARVVVLKGDAPSTGMIGLLCFLDPPLDVLDEISHHIEIGDAIFAAHTDDVTEVHRRLTGSAGRLHAANAGDVMSFFDPDGYFFELSGVSQV